MEGCILNSSIKITVNKPFDEPAYDADIVVFSNENSYLKKDDAIKHLYQAIKYSKKYNVYCVSCRFVKDNALNICMISPEGKIVGNQSATHLNLTYRGIFNPSAELSIIDTPLAKIFLAVDTDIFHPEVSRAAACMGAELIIACRFTDTINNMPYRTCIGSENSAFSNEVYVLDVTEDGGIFIDPWKDTQCIRNSKKYGEFGKVWCANLQKLRTDNTRQIFNLQNPLFKKYIDILER